MNTTHAFSGHQHSDYLMSTPLGRETLAHAEAWRRDPVNRVLRKIYGDPFSGWDLGQTAALADLIYHGRNGQIDIIGIQVGATPHRDSMRDENRALLANLPHGITAEVYDGNGPGADGTLTIPAGLAVTDPSAGPGEEPADAWEAVPLEIGYTDATRTLSHLWEFGAVARWPYGSDMVYVVVTKPRYCLTPGISGQGWS